MELVVYSIDGALCSLKVGISLCSLGFRAPCSIIDHVSKGPGASHGTAVITDLFARPYPCRHHEKPQNPTDQRCRMT